MQTNTNKQEIKIEKKENKEYKNKLKDKVSMFNRNIAKTLNQEEGTKDFYNRRKTFF